MSIIKWLLLLALTLTLPQVPPQPHVQPPTLKEINWSLGGNTRLAVTFERNQVPTTFTDIHVCGTNCRGEKHILHPECDSSCDAPCTTIHQQTSIHGNVSGDVSAFPQLQQALQKFGVPEYTGVHLMDSIFDEMCDQVGDLDKFDLQAKWDHWNEKHCALTFRDCELTQFNYLAHIQLLRDTDAGNGRIVTVQGPKVDTVMLTIWIPTGKYKEEVKVRCKCSVVGESREDHVSLNDPSSGITIQEDGKTRVATGQDLAKYGVVCVAENMNEAVWTAENPTNQPVEICINPGQQLVSTDPSVQDLCTTSETRLKLPAAMMTPGQVVPAKVSAPGSVACLNMTKATPTSKNSFRIGTTSPPAIQRLAAFNAKESFRGLEGQIRIWIVTDHASLGDIQKYMIFPKPTPAMYLRALHTVATVGKVDVTSPEYRKCVEPILLTGGGAKKAQFAWLARTLAKVNSERVDTLQADAFAEWWGERGTRYADQSSADLANALCSSPDPKLQAFGIKFLTTIVPAEKRATIANKNALNGIGLWLTANNPEQAKHALTVLETYKSPQSRLFLLNPNKELPAELKDQAKQLAASIK